MSYGFKMGFKQCKDFGDAFSKIEEFCRKVKENLRDTLKKNEFSVDCIEESRKRNSDAEELFIYRFFNFRFVYWDKYNLLGMCFGNGTHYYPVAEDIFDTEVYFQNSTDQNYEFEEWSDKIDVFHSLKEEVEAISDKDIVNCLIAFRDNYFSEEDREDLETYDAEYLKRTFLYAKIFSELGLISWMYGKENPLFHRISINLVDSLETEYMIRGKLRDYLHETEKIEDNSDYYR